MKRLPVVLVALLAIGTLSACAGGSAGGAAATVNGVVITRASLFEDLDALAGNARIRQSIESEGLSVYGDCEEAETVGPDGAPAGTLVCNEGIYSAGFVAEWLTARVADALVESELTSRGGTVTPEDLEAAESQFADNFGPAAGELPQSFRDRQVRAIASRNALTRLLEAEPVPPQTVSEEEVRAYYDRNIEAIVQQEGGEMTCISHVMAAFNENLSSAQPTPEQDQAAFAEAQRLSERIRGGEDLAAVAASDSDDTTSGAKGGDFGCQGRPTGLGTAFDEALATQPVGEVGEPVRSNYGYHLIVVRNRGVPPFEDIRDQLEALLVQQQESSGGSSAYSAWYEEALQSSDITVNPQYGTFAPAFGRVVPPEGPMIPAGTVPGLVPVG